MTRRLLQVLAELHAPGLVRLGLAVLVAILLPLTLSLDLLSGFLWSRRVTIALSTSEIRCPLGHVVEVHGDWQCACGYRFRGPAWQDCPACGSRPYAITCACGLSVPSPLPPGEEG